MPSQYLGTQNRLTDGPFAKTGYIPLPLTQARALAAADVPGTSATLWGGLLHKTSVPILEGGGLSGTPLRINFAGGGQGTIAWDVTLPPDCDTGAPVYLKADLATVAAGTETPGFSVKTTWGGTTVVSDTLTQSGTARAVDSATIAAADVPADVFSANVALIPGTHANDILYLYGAWLEYTKL